MYIDKYRVEDIFQELSRQLEKVTIGELKRSAYNKLEERAYFHESEEKRAKKQLPILLNEPKQREIYKQINLNKISAKEKAEAYIRAKQGVN